MLPTYTHHVGMLCLQGALERDIVLLRWSTAPKFLGIYLFPATSVRFLPAVIWPAVLANLPTLLPRNLKITLIV
ncbi:hypothetical protein BD414DRAFT_496740 [Trametes punicea]|nr:hypothetical protein BD414DRAFT_496740 [Trametes punicea]